MKKLLGIVLSFIIIRFSTKTYGYISWFIILALIVCLIVVLVYGKVTNQAHSWINLFWGIKFQPSEFIKIATVVWMAFFCTSKKREGFKDYLLLFAIIGLITILIILQPDLGTASIYAMIVFLMFMALNISKKVKRNIILTVLGMGLIVFLAVEVPV